LGSAETRGSRPVFRHSQSGVKSCAKLWQASEQASSRLARGLQRALMVDLSRLHAGKAATAAGRFHRSEARLRTSGAAASLGFATLSPGGRKSEIENIRGRKCGASAVMTSVRRRLSSASEINCSDMTVHCGLWRPRKGESYASLPRVCSTLMRAAHGRPASRTVLSSAARGRGFGRAPGNLHSLRGRAAVM
jgi:hypothetical protein